MNTINRDMYKQEWKKNKKSMTSEDMFYVGIVFSVVFSIVFNVWVTTVDSHTNYQAVYAAPQGGK